MLECDASSPPTAIRAIRGGDPDGKLIAAADLRALNALFLAGERADPDTVRWIGAKLDKPVVDHWWQTELGWPALASCLGLNAQPAALGSAGYPVPGFRFDVLDSLGQPVESGETGSLTIAKLLPPGAMIGLWQTRKAMTAISAHSKTPTPQAMQPCETKTIHM